MTESEERSSSKHRQLSYSVSDPTLYYHEGDPDYHSPSLRTKYFSFLSHLKHYHSLNQIKEIMDETKALLRNATWFVEFCENEELKNFGKELMSCVNQFIQAKVAACSLYNADPDLEKQIQFLLKTIFDRAKKLYDLMNSFKIAENLSENDELISSDMEWAARSSQVLHISSPRSAEIEYPQSILDSQNSSTNFQFRKLSGECLQAIDQFSSVILNKNSNDLIHSAKYIINSHNALSKEFQQQSQYNDQIVILTGLYKDLVKIGKNYIENPGSDPQEFLNHKQKVVSILNTLPSSVSSVLSYHNEITIKESSAYDIAKEYSYVTHILPLNQELIPIIKKNQTHFLIEEERPIFNRSTYALNIVPDIYYRDYFKVGHIKCIRIHQMNTTKETFIIVVMEEPKKSFYPAMIISKKGYEEFIVPVRDVGQGKLKDSKILKYLQMKFPGDSVYLIKDSTNIVTKDIARIEQDSPQVKNELTVGIIYAKSYQTNPLDMFANQANDSFLSFLSVMNIPPAGEFKLKWKQIFITVHIAPYLNSEEHRRCVGNSSSIIFFLEDGDPFDASEVDKMGMVPQIFIVVQPYLLNYRVGFFRSGNLKPFGPELAINLVLSGAALADFIFTKIHNGNVMFYYTPPMNRAWMLTRQSNIENICTNYFNKKYH